MVNVETGVTKVIHYLSLPSKEWDAGPEGGKAEPTTSPLGH